MSTSKCVLICLNSIFWTGLVLLSLLLFIHHEKELDIPITLLESFSLPFDTNMIVLLVLFLTGIIGYVTILIAEEKRKLIVTIFSSALILLTCLLSAASFFEYWHHDKIRREYLDQFTNSVVQYNSTTEQNVTITEWDTDGGIYTSDDVDRIQTIFNCCGSYNFTDFGASPWGLKNPSMVPESCCDEQKMSAINETCRALNFETELEYIYPDGCFKIVEAQFLHWLDTLIVVQVFLAIFTLIALVGSSCWIRKTRRGAIPYQLVNEEQEDDTESIQEN